MKIADLAPNPRDELKAYLDRLAVDNPGVAGQVQTAFDDIVDLAKVFVAASSPDALRAAGAKRNREAREMEKAAEQFKGVADLLANPPGQWGVLRLRNAPTMAQHISTPVLHRISRNPQPGSLQTKLPREEVERDLRAYEHMCLSAADILRDLNTSTRGGANFFARCIELAYALGQSRFPKTKQKEHVPKFYKVLCRLVQGEAGRSQALDLSPPGLGVDSWYTAIEVLEDPASHSLFGADALAFHKRKTESSLKKAEKRKARRKLGSAKLRAPTKP